MRHLVDVLVSKEFHGLSNFVSDFQSDTEKQDSLVGFVGPATQALEYRKAPFVTANNAAGEHVHDLYSRAAISQSW